MTVKATLTLEETRLLWQQSTLVSAEVSNEGRTSLPSLNAQNRRAAPTVVIVDTATGRADHFAEPAFPDGGDPIVDLQPGKQRAERFSLLDRARFAAPGLYEISVAYAWDARSDGDEEEPPAPPRAVSPSVEVWVLPAEPRALSLEPMTGALGVTSFAAWVNEESGAFGLWLSTIGAVPDPRIAQTTFLGAVPGPITPILSIPPATTPHHQHVAWIAGRELFHLGHARGQVTPVRALDLGTTGYRVIPPLLEDPFEGAAVQGAEALLVAPSAGGFEMRIAHLDAQSTLSEAVVVRCPLPRWAATSYRVDGARRTFFLLPTKDGVILSVSAWSRGAGPQPPWPLVEWEGEVLAVDLAVIRGNTVVGAALMTIATDEGPRHVVRRFRLTSADVIQLGPDTVIPVQEDLRIEGAILRVNSDEESFVVMKTGGDSPRWLFLGADGKIRALDGPADEMALPADIVFARWTTPVLLYKRPGFGLDLTPLGPLPRLVSPR
ncbi:Hypothetical protein A7982_05593 [Minicystis rosea]|nr:Hypothetical protein A7982_05593 [Minicystis rosea]